MASEDPNSFLFDFDIVCRTYGYTDDAHRLRLFPATLNASALRRFMGLGEHAITDWDGMRRIFLRKYQPYCRSKDSKDDIFRMNQQEDENLEEYLERFAYNLQKSKHRSMTLDLIRTIFLKGIREEYLDDLNLMGKGDISTLPFEEIADLCEKYSRSKAKIGKRTISSKATKFSSASVTRAEIGNLLEEFKTDLFSTLGTQIDTLKAKKRQEEEDQMMAIFCPKCRKKHALKDCPLENIQVCAFCTENHDIFHCSKVKPYSPYPQPYQQYPQQQVVYPHQPQPTQQELLAPPPINPTQLQLPSNPQPPRPTQIPAQPVQNPNNKAERPAYNVDKGPSYPTLPLQNINFRSGKVLHKESPAVDRQEENEENENETPLQRKPNDDIKNKQIQPLHPPPFPDRLVQTKLPMSIPQFDVLDELNNVYIKIPLLQAIKDIPIYTKSIKELCLKKPTRKRVDPQTIHVIGHLAGLMSNTISMEKYVDPGIPRVTTIINNIHVPNTLIDLGATINVMTLETMKTLQLTNLQYTTIVLELADRSKVIPEGILEDIIVSLDSWEYPVEFLVLQPKSNLGGHPIILGRPWLATVDAFIGCISCNMII
eukprot:PITA_33242